MTAFSGSEAALTYAEVGATRRAELPAGYGHLRVTTFLGHGRALFEAACDAVLEWEMHRRVGLRVPPGTPRAAQGVVVAPVLALGPLRVAAPCRVVWAVREERRAGFAYGTLPGHPERGEEAFLVEWDGPGDGDGGNAGGTDGDRTDGGGADGGAGEVRLTVTAFSRPASWYARLAGPLVPVFQRAYAHRCGRVLRREAARRAG
jgi:uncharacterized protein (UPF0548 family)